ncbi:MAG: hypothetical protein AAFR47_16055 [Pseudomonadota bacterium]
MRAVLVLLLPMLVVLSACYTIPTASEAPPAAAASATAVTPQRLARWEDEWQEARQEVVVARQSAVSTGQPIPPEVDAEVTELLDRDLDAPSDEDRLQRLQDAVSDARRLAELVSAG